MISPLHYISQEPHLPNIMKACEAGCDWIQLRAKNSSFQELKQLAIEAKKITDSFGARLIINDSLEIALTIAADGVHLGKKDMDVAEARKITGPGFIIGGSTNSLEDVLEIAKKEVNYLGLGPLRHTLTKTDLNPVLGIGQMRQILSEVKMRGITIPIIGIGGITRQDIRPLAEIGLHGVAISGLITFDENRKEVIQEIYAHFR